MLRRLGGAGALRAPPTAHEATRRALPARFWCRRAGLRQKGGETAGETLGAMSSKCSAKPSEVAWKAGLHAMHYLYHHRHRGITYSSHGNLEPVCYYDSGFNQRQLGTRPQYSFVIIWAGAAVVWMSKRHPQTPGSVSEAEYCAMYYAWKWTKWIREVLIDMGLGEYVKRPTLMFGDNRNARDWAIEEMTTDGNRQIDRQYRIVRERVKMGEILPVWIDGKTNPADVGTKAQANAPMTENMLSFLTGQREIPLPDGTQILFGPVSNPVMRGNKAADSVKLSRRNTRCKSVHPTSTPCAINHPCLRSLQSEDNAIRADVDSVRKHIADRDIPATEYDRDARVLRIYDKGEFDIAEGDTFYTVNGRIIRGWNCSINPPVGKDGLPLVDVSTNIETGAITFSFL